jgi:hypothetical protein
VKYLGLLINLEYNRQIKIYFRSDGRGNAEDSCHGIRKNVKVSP